MTQIEFENRLTALWLKTQIPLTVENLVRLTGQKSRAVAKWLRKLEDQGAVEGVELESGEIAYELHGRARPMDGPETLVELARLEKMRREAKARVRAEWQAKQDRRAGISAPEPEPDPEPEFEEISPEENALIDLSDHGDSGIAGALVKQAKDKLTTTKPGDKSLLVSMGASALLGPTGWLYAGDWKEAGLSTAAWLAFVAIMPTFLLLPLLTVIVPTSALVGLGYAMRYNKHGSRKALLPKDDKKKKKK